MAEACHVGVIIHIDGSAALLHFLEELGWKKNEGRKHEICFRFVLLKIGFVCVGDDTQEKTSPGRTVVSVIKKKQKQNRRAIVQAGFELQSIFNYQLFFLVILMFY